MKKRFPARTWPLFLLCLGAGLPALFPPSRVRAQTPTAPASADPPHRAQIAGAQAAAEGWLKRIDAGEYGQSWREAASPFQRTMDEARWTAVVGGARLPLGAVTSRRLLVSRFSPTMPGAPDGEYVFLQFETEFENKKKAVETLVPMVEGGRWKVSGYYIK